MASIIIYAADTKYLGRTISELVDSTPPYLVEDIIICNDTGHKFEYESINVITTDKIGRAKCWNAAAKQASSDELVFLRDTTKFGKDWLQPVIARVKNSKKLVSPRIHTLNPEFWSTENKSWRRFGWRWDLSLYSRHPMLTDESPSISSNCIAVSADWFETIGGFDDGMKNGAGEDIELSLRSWLFGGSCEIDDDSYIAVVQQTDNDKNTVDNLGRIVEMWLPSYASRFLSSRGLKQNELNIGRLSNLMALQDKKIHSDEWFIQRCQPELGSLYNLRGIAAEKSIAVVGYGPSIDLIDPSWIYKHDIVIAVDYMGLVFDADYVVADSSHVAVELRSTYKPDQFVLPFALSDRTLAKYIPANEVVDGCYQFELLNIPGKVISEFPPFCNYEQSLHAAVNFALFLKPRTISLFGCDNKIVGGKSHSAKIEYYDGGKLWSDSDATRRKFQYFDYGINQLGRLAHSLGIPLVRVGHA